MKTIAQITLLTALAAAPLCAEQRWALENLPTGVSEHVMVHDTVNDRLVVFGGYQNGVLSNDTWVLQHGERAWRQIHPEGIAPSPRREAVAVFDAERSRMIVFGGRSATGNTSDTFALYLQEDEVRWVEIANVDGIQPPPRTHGNLVLDVRNDRAILYGGANSPTLYRDTWALSLQEGKECWEELATVGHPGGDSVGNAAIYDPVGQRMIVFRPLVFQLVALSLDADLRWTNHTSASLPAEGRRYAAAAYDSARHLMLLHGGLAPTRTLSETYGIDLQTMQFEKLADETDSDGRFWHAAVYVESRDQFIVAGGRDFPRNVYSTMGIFTRPPEAPTGLAPNGDLLLKSKEIELTWQHSAGICNGQYIVEMYLDKDGELIPQSELVIEGNRAVFTPDPTYGQEALTYIWLVMAVNGNGASSYSVAATFRHMQEGLQVGDDDRLSGAEDVAGQTQVIAAPEQEPAGTTIVGGGSGDASGNQTAGCAGTDGGKGISLALLVTLLAGLGLRRARRA